MQRWAQLPVRNMVCIIWNNTSAYTIIFYGIYLSSEDAFRGLHFARSLVKLIEHDFYRSSNHQTQERDIFARRTLRGRNNIDTHPTRPLIAKQCEHVTFGKPSNLLLLATCILYDTVERF